MGGLFRRLEPLLRYKGVLGVAGLIVLCAMLVLLQILHLSIFAPVGADQTAALISLIVRSVFWIALTAIAISALSYLPGWLFIPVSKIEYAAAVFRMINPLKEDGLAPIMDQMEPYVGFPYYSRESDHPSYWPARVGQDRTTLAKLYEGYFGRSDVQTALAAARAKAGDTSSVEVLSSAPGGPDALSAPIMTARSFFNSHLNGDAEALAQAIGVPLANEFLAIERAREEIKAYLPNRIAFIRVRNAGSRAVRNLTIEYEVAGIIYDTKVRAVSTGASEPLLPFEHRLTIPRILPGQSYDVTVWYIYQSVDERTFPDKINFIQELTQGFTISNIAVDTGGKIVFNAKLLKDVPAYDRLYDGAARRSDNPDRELAALFNARAKRAAPDAKKWEDENPTAKNLTFDELVSFPIEESQITSVWVGFKSPAGKRYRAVCVYEHPSGPYALLSSEDRDRADFAIVAAALAERLQGEAEKDISDRGSDICATITRPQGFTREAIVEAFQGLAPAGYGEFGIENLNYHKDA